MRTIVIAPHPDDETLGLGGTILRRQAEGAEIAWVIVTQASNLIGWDEGRIARRSMEIDQITKFYGFNRVYRLNFDSAKLDSIPLSELITEFTHIFNEFNPEEVFVPHFSDAHSDHRAVFDAVSACTKWFRYPSVHRVLAYETLSETEFGLRGGCSFRPNYFINIENFLEGKIEAMKIYANEVGVGPFPRSEEGIRALSTFRGTSSGYLAAEAFELLRERV